MCTHFRGSGRRAGYPAADEQDRLRVPRPGQPVGRHGPRARRVLPRRRSRVRRRRRRPGRAHHTPCVGGPRGGAEPDREQPAGPPRRLDRLPRGHQGALVPAGGRHPGARLRGRPLDGAVLRPRRCRRPRPRRRRPPGPDPRPEDAGLGRGTRGPHGRDHRSRRGKPPLPGRGGVGPRHLWRREPQLARPGRRQRRATGRRGGPRHREAPGREARHRAPGLGCRTLAP